MINYLLKREDIKMNKAEIDKMINSAISDLKIDTSKIDAVSLLHKSFDYECEKIFKNARNLILKDDPFAYVPDFAIRKDIFSNSVISGEIIITYYPFEEIKKLNYKNITDINYVYSYFDDISVNAIFESTIKNFTFKNPAYDFVKQNDAVKLNIKIFQNNALVKEDNNFNVIANRTNNFTINNIVLNHRFGEFFTFNDPLNRRWEVQIVEIIRTIPMPITNQNVQFLKIPYVINLMTLKTFFSSMIKKDNAIKEAMRYFDFFISELENNNNIIFPDEYINSKIANYTSNYLEKVRPENREAIQNSIIQKDEYGIQIIENAVRSAKREIIEGLAKKAIYILEKIKVHNMEITQELNQSSIVLFQNSYFNKKENKNVNTVKDDLIDIKIALKLLQLNVPQLFMIIARDAAIAV
ncbi:hypothetical protein NPA07_04060 [Mycoplasmopsis caviae]|uniref:Trigger factor n=1 Tax=Mycoplasmopsis caviae TaxID=55603 RepID=A0A3P8KXB1_9BACT|nr:hypothetical protein [Mycoplasmopsis caviae]UUD34955.1 hypothetical protein NPA07_04060 [Mycoplasmopsis caviae]VDR42217.1 Uncharacterised protein [Mycoplasmopsis caviae]